MESAPNLPRMDCEVFSLHAHDEYDMILIYITERRIYLSISSSHVFLLVESGILSFGIWNTAQMK